CAVRSGHRTTRRAAALVRVRSAGAGPEGDRARDHRRRAGVPAAPQPDRGGGRDGGARGSGATRPVEWAKLVARSGTSVPTSFRIRLAWARRANARLCPPYGLGRSSSPTPLLTNCSV